MFFLMNEECVARLFSNIFCIGMYREGYQEQQMNHMQMGYDYRSPPQGPLPPYKPSPSM